MGKSVKNLGKLLGELWAKCGNEPTLQLLAYFGCSFKKGASFFFGAYHYSPTIGRICGELDQPLSGQLLREAAGILLSGSQSLSDGGNARPRFFHL